MKATRNFADKGASGGCSPTACSHSRGGGFIVNGRNQGNPLHERPYYRRLSGPGSEGYEDVHRELVRQGLLPDLQNLTLKALPAEKPLLEPVVHDREERECPAEKIDAETTPDQPDPDVVGQSSSFIIANAEVKRGDTTA